MDIPAARLHENVVDRNSSSSRFNPAHRQDNLPGLYAREVVAGLLQGIEQVRVADRLELLAFLSRHTIPGDPQQSSFRAGDADPVLHEVQESLVALEVARAKAESARVTLLQGIKASLPAYMREAIGEPVQHRSNVDRAFIDQVDAMCAAQHAGAAAVCQFSQCDNQTKLKLLGFSHSRFFLEDLRAMGLPGLYEAYKQPYLSPQQVGFAYKDGFNALLIEGLPENQKMCFKKIMTEPDYEKRKEALEVAILNFLEAPDAVSAAWFGIPTPVSEMAPAITTAAVVGAALPREHEAIPSDVLPQPSATGVKGNEPEHADATIDYQFEAEVAALSLEAAEKSE